MKITIVGLGPGPFGLLTSQALRTIQEATTLYFRTSSHPALHHLPSSAPWRSFDYMDQGPADGQSVHRAIAGHLLDVARAGAEVTYAVPGDPLLDEPSARILRVMASQSGVPVDVVPGVPFLSLALTWETLASPDAFQIVGPDMAVEPDPGATVLVCGLQETDLATRVKTALLRTYPPHHHVEVVSIGPDSSGAVRRTVPLERLGEETGHGRPACLIVPALPLDQASGNVAALRRLVAHLRGPRGCPWDRSQDHGSLRPFLIEETYEVLDAIEREDWDDLKEELGDLLLQVLLHAQIGEEDGAFDLNDVVRGTGSKLVRRHPHVFGEAVARTAEDVVQRWEQLKRREREHLGHPKDVSALHDLPKGAPALLQARKIQEKAAGAGFDWPDRKGLVDKLMEEIGELMEARTSKEVREELGDVLFMLSKLGVYHNVDAEDALLAANAKFVRRFRRMERECRERGLEMGKLSAQELLALWERAKGSTKGAPRPRQPEAADRGPQ